MRASDYIADLEQDYDTPEEAMAALRDLQVAITEELGRLEALILARAAGEPVS